jgi:hypothetical protein
MVVLFVLATFAIAIAGDAFHRRERKYGSRTAMRPARLGRARAA